MGVRGLVPRGTLFERYMTCPVEPTRNGLYQSLDKTLLLSLVIKAIFLNV